MRSMNKLFLFSFLLLTFSLNSFAVVIAADVVRANTGREVIELVDKIDFDGHGAITSADYITAMENFRTGETTRTIFIRIMGILVNRFSEGQRLTDANELRTLQAQLRALAEEYGGEQTGDINGIIRQIFESQADAEVAVTVAAATAAMDRDPLAGDRAAEAELVEIAGSPAAAAAMAVGGAKGDAHGAASAKPGIRQRRGHGGDDSDRGAEGEGGARDDDGHDGQAGGEQEGGKWYSLTVRQRLGVVAGSALAFGAAAYFYPEMALKSIKIALMAVPVALAYALKGNKAPKNKKNKENKQQDDLNVPVAAH